MDCYRLDWDRIVRISETALYYRDDRGDVLDLDLKKCRDRYLKYINSHPKDDPSLILSAEDNENFRWVADRCFDWISDAYFEFYGWPHIRFEKQMKETLARRFLGFIGRNWREKYYHQFCNIQLELEKFGWETFDKS